MLITALLISVLLFFGHKQSEVVKKHGDQASLVFTSAKQVNNQTIIITSVKNEYTTPTEHDQLVVSSSLEGTDIDGALRADINGELILDIGIRDFFDYFLSTADEVGPELAIAEIQRYIQNYLPEKAKTQALRLLENYLRYKQTEYQLQQTPINQRELNDNSAIALLRNSFDQLQTQRRSLFTPEQDSALFGLEDSYAKHTLSSLELMVDETTSDQEKREALQVLESQLPQELSSSFDETKQARQQQEEIDVLFVSELDDAQVYESLSELGLSQEQVGRVLERRQQQRQFEAQYQRYYAERQSLDETSRQFKEKLAVLQKRFFVTPESRTQAVLRDLQLDNP